MRELNREGRAFLEETRQLDEPTDRDRQRIRAKMLAAIGAPGASGAPGAPGGAMTKAAVGGKGAALAPSGFFGGWAGGAITGALLAVGVLGGEAAFERATGHDWLGRPEASVRSAAEVPAASAGASAAVGMTAAPDMPPRPADRGASGAPAGASGVPAGASGVPAGATVSPEEDRSARTAVMARPANGAPSAPAPEASVAPEAPSAQRTSTVDEELAALRGAQEALQTGKPDEALRVLDHYAATHTGVALEEERRAARIIAVCKAGGGSPARADAERFLRERPDSPLGERVRAACLGQMTP